MTRIAVIRALALGDMLCAIPALRALRARFPDATISLIGLPWAAEIVERFPTLLDELIDFPGFPGIPEVEFDPDRSLDSMAELQRRRFVLAVQLQGNGLVINEFVALLGARRLAGFIPAGGEPPRDSRDDVWLPYPERGTEVDERQPSLIGNVLNFGGLAGRRRDDDEALFLPGLTEVHLEKRSGIVGGHRPLDLLRLVEVSQSDVARRRRQGLGRGGPVLCDVNATLRFAEEGTLQVRVRHEEVDGVRPKGAAEVLDRALEHASIFAPGARLLAG